MLTSHQEMLTAHISSLALIATPFNPRTPQPFAFGRGSGWEGITQVRLLSCCSSPLLRFHLGFPRPAW
jgi:hypothetical protein